MKTITLTCLLSFLFVFGTKSQNHPFDRFFDRYANKDGFLTLNFSNLPADLLNEKEKDPDLRITSLRILTVQDEKLNLKLNFYTEIVPQINRTGYEELMNIRHNGEKTILLCKKNKKRLTEVLFVSGGHQNVLIEITGSLSLEQAREMTSQVADNHKNEDSDDGNK